MTGQDGHVHPRAPMVEEITDFEVLEIAVRELAIEKGLFTAEDHRCSTEAAEQINPTSGGTPRRQGLARPRPQAVGRDVCFA